jgi:hypothetical protein
MLVTIAAAVLALAPAERPAPKAVPAPSVLTALEQKPVTACEGAGRLQVRTEPTLLYRPDPNDRAKKLIEMPMAQGCLLGGAR